MSKFKKGDDNVNNEQLTKALGTIKNYVDTTKMNYLKYGSIDVDTLKTTGIYSLASNCTNNATTNAGTMVVDFNVGTPYQLWIPDNTHAFYKRNWDKTNSTWGAWSATIASDISGNAATATKLATARNITLTGGVTGSVSFNGTSDVSITTVVGGNSHSHSNYLPLSGGNMTGDLGLSKDLNVYTDSTINFRGIGVGSSGHIYQNENGLNIESIANYSNPGIFFNLDRREDNVHGGDSNDRAASEAVVSMMHDGTRGSIVKATKFDGDLTGNSATATKLAKAKTINGTSFDGSENITTANWGTARTLTIGNTGKSVNGSDNVTWSLSEIGALPLTGGTLTGRVKFNSEVFIDNGQYIKTNIFEDDSYVPILGTAEDNCVVGDQEFNLQLRSHVNPSIKLPEGSYKMYHEGNKPTAADIGAVSNTYLTNAGSSVFTWVANTCANKITMGYNNSASQPSSVLLGCNNTGKGEYSYIIGHDCLLNSGWGVTVGKNNKIYGSSSFTGGINNTIGTSSSEIPYAHAVGYQNTITGGYGVAVGNKNTVSGANSIALGYNNSVKGQKSSSLGYSTSATGTFSTAIGGYTTTLGEGSTAIGYRTTAGGNGSFAEGFSSNSATSIVSGYSPSSTTYDTIKSKWSSYKFSLAHGNYSHCEGYNNIACGQTSHAEGWYTMTKADCGHAGGYYTVANSGQYVIGHYNTEYSGSTTGTSNNALIVGNGAPGALSNACRITYAGAVIGKAAYKSSGADYAEYFEWLDGNPNAEDRRGYFVTMKGKNIQIAKKGDYILGIVSAYPAVIGNNDIEWQGQFLLDEFGAPVKKKYTGINEITGEEEEYEYFVVNPEYDPDKEYIHREDRPEWDAIGMMGVLSVYDDGTCEVDGFSECNDEGIATASETGYRVIERVNDHIVKVLFR